MAAVKRTLYIKENGEDVEVHPETSADQVKMENGSSLEDVLSEDLVAAFEKALIGGNPASQTL